VIRIGVNARDQVEPRRRIEGDAQAPDLIEPEVGEDAAQAQKNAEENDRRGGVTTPPRPGVV
jgi:hypothetical protein